MKLGGREGERYGDSEDGEGYVVVVGEWETKRGGSAPYVPAATGACDHCRPCAPATRPLPQPRRKLETVPCTFCKWKSP